MLGWLCNRIHYLNFRTRSGNNPHAFAVEIGKDLFRDTGLGCVAASEDNPDLWYPVLEMSTVVGVSLERYSRMLAALIQADEVPPQVFGAVADILSSIASSINHLHTMGLAHRDIKPHNILCEVVSSEGPFTFRDPDGRACRAVLIDLGLSLYNDVEYITYDDHDDAAKRQKLNSSKKKPALGTARAMMAAACAQRLLTAQQAAAHTNPTNGSMQGEKLRPVHQGDLENRHL
jgi:hypothetical protein